MRAKPVSLSIVVPVLNEEAMLPRFLRDIDRCKASLDFDLECLIVDGASEDQSVELCNRHGYEVIRASRGRGQQLHSGAERAMGEVLFFLHADTRIQPEHCRQAVEICRRNGVVAGGFNLRFDDEHLILRLAEKLNPLRFKLSRVLYGDHGVFLRKETYRQIGGIPQQPLFEDMELSNRLKRAGKIILVDPPVITSARRFRAHGVIRTYLKMAALHILYWLGVSPVRLSKLYQESK